MRVMMIWIVIAAACATPYQEAGGLHLLVRGGYSSESLTHNRHVIRVLGNTNTKLEATMSYARQRASELCPTGYDVLEELSRIVPNDNPTTPVPSDGLPLPESMLFVQCKSAASGDIVLASGAEAPDDRWWCATDFHGLRESLCTRKRETCQAQRAERESKGAHYDPCAPRVNAACFRIVTGKIPSNSCAPQLYDCKEIREDMLFLIRRDHDHNLHVLSECAVVE